MAEAKSNIPWMPLYCGDYLRDTGHLTTLEHGAYFLLLIQAWNRDGLLPLDEDRLRALCRLQSKEWNRSRDALLAFFYRTETGYRQRRMDAELLKVEHRISQKIDAGKKSGEKRKAQQDQGRNLTDVATPVDVPLQRNGQRNALQPQAQPQKQEKQPREAFGEPRNPAANDPRTAWAHLAEELETEPGEHFGRPIVHGLYFDEVAQMVCEAARYPANWSGSWAMLIAWLKDGFEPDEIGKAIRTAASRQNYKPPGSLKYFDGLVREAAATQGARR